MMNSARTIEDTRDTSTQENFQANQEVNSLFKSLVHERAPLNKPLQKNGMQLYFDLIRDDKKGNRITVNGEFFTESPEYNPEDPMGSLERFLLRVLFKGDQQLFNLNYPKLKNWSQAVFSVMVEVVASDNRSLNDELLLKDVSALTDIKLNEQNEVYADCYILDNNPDDNNIFAKIQTGKKAWHLPGFVTIQCSFDDTDTRIAKFEASNDLLQRFASAKASPLINPRRLETLESALKKIKSPTSPEYQQTLLEIEQLKKQIEESNQAYKSASIYELELLKKSIETFDASQNQNAPLVKVSAQNIFAIIEKLNDQTIPHDDLGIYFSVISLLRLSLEQPENIVFLLTYKNDYSASLANPWAKELKAQMDIYVNQAAINFYDKAMREINKIDISSNGNLDDKVKRLLKEINIYKDGHPDQLFPLIKLLNVIKNTIQQNKIFGKLLLPSDVKENDHVFAALLDFKQYFVFLNYNKMLGRLDDEILLFNTKNTQDDFIIREKSEAIHTEIESLIRNMREEPIEEDLNKAELLISAISQTIDMLQKPSRAEDFNSSSYKSFPNLARHLDELAGAIVTKQINEQTAKLEKTEKSDIPSRPKLAKKLSAVFDSVGKNSTLNSSQLRRVQSGLLKLSQHTEMMKERTKKGLTLSQQEVEAVTNTLRQLEIAEGEGHLDTEKKGANPLSSSDPFVNESKQEQVEPAVESPAEQPLTREVANLFYDTLCMQIKEKNLPYTNAMLKLANDLIGLHTDDAKFDATKEAYNFLNNYLSTVIENPELAKDHVEQLQQHFSKNVANILKALSSSISAKDKAKIAYLALAQPLIDADSIPIEQRAKLITIATDFLKAATNVSDTTFLNEISKVISCMQEPEKAYKILDVLENLRYEKAKNYFDSLSNARSDSILANPINKFVKAVNEAAKAHRVSALEYTDFIYLAARFLESKNDEGVVAFDKELLRLLQNLPKEKLVNDIFEALDDIRFAKAKVNYDGSIAYGQRDPQLEDASNLLVHIMAEATTVDQHDRANLLFNAACLNESTKPINQKSLAQLDIAIKVFVAFDTSIKNFRENLNPQKSQNTTANDYKNIMISTCLLSYANAYSMLENVALSFKGIDPFLSGHVIELLNKAKHMIEGNELSLEPATIRHVAQFLMSIAFALQNPVKYFNSNTSKIIEGLFNNNKLGAFVEFKEKLIDNYARKEANYKLAESELETQLQINFPNMISNEMKQPILGVLKETQRLKKIPSKEDRVPTLTQTLGQMTSLLKKPTDLLIQQNTFQLADTLEKKSWSQSLRAKVVISLGFALLPLLPISIPLIIYGFNSYKKEEEKRSQSLSFLTKQSAEKAGDARTTLNSDPRRQKTKSST